MKGRGGKRGRKRARERKYTMMGVDLGRDGSETTVEGYWKDGVFHVTSVSRVEPHLSDAGGSEP